MVDINFVDKLKIIWDFLSGNSLIVLIMMLVLVIIMDLLYGSNNKNTKKLYFIIVMLIVLFGIIIYNKSFLNIMDTYIANIFRITYFPSIIEYVTMILITLIIQFISILKNSGLIKHINIWVGIIIELLFVINLMAMNNINVNLNTLTSIYENNLLLSIFQISSFVFMIWIIFNLIIFIIFLFIDNKIELPKLKKDFY